MRLKTFQARSMTEAMRQIKETLGEDAIIVNSRSGPGGSIRVTAAVEQAPPSFSAALKQVEEDDGFTDEEIMELVTDTLLKHRVPGQVSEKIIAAALIQDTRDPQEALAKALQKSFTFLQPEKAAKPVMLVGPPGAGKTLMAAKLAAAAVMGGKKPAVITTDIARAGGVEQLTAFLDILGLPLQTADDAKSLKSALAKAKGAAPVIVDTGGLNPFDPKEMKALALLLSAGDMDAALVLPAGIDAEEGAEIAMTFDILGVRRIIPTRLDFARHLGGILSAAERGGLFFAEASHTPQVANGVLMLDAKKLAALLMPKPQKKTRAKKGKS